MDVEQQERIETLQTFEKGRRLFLLTKADGYQDLLDILEREVVKAEFRLMNVTAGASPELLRDLHAHARAARSIFEQLQLRIAAAIENGRQLPQLDTSLDYQITNL